MTTFRVRMAASLDGHIADADGSIAWAAPFQSVDYGYDHFLAQIGTVVMGRTTYDHLHALGLWPKDKRCVVVTTRSMETAPDNVEPWMGDVSQLAESLKSSNAGDVWVAGGAKAIRAFMDLGVISHLELLVMPVLLGSGKPLFTPAERPTRLTLLGARTHSNGVVKLSYVVG